MKNGFMPKMVLLDGDFDVDYSGGVQGGDTNYAQEYVDSNGVHWIYITEEDWGMETGYYTYDFSQYYGPDPNPNWTPVS